LPTARLLALILLIVVRAVSQDHIANGMPSEVHDEINPAGSSTSTSAPSVSLPNAPTLQRVIDKKFIAVMGALGGAESLRFTTRKLVLEHELAAGAPWVTNVPSNRHDIAKDGTLFAVELLVAYELKKPHSWLPGDRVIRKLWWAYPAAMVAIHIKNGVGNIQTQAPSGCPVAECALP
jgi:hypothetical protein